jgi:hypothetical protein
MKKITLFSFIFISMLSFSQQQQYLLGFEPSTQSGDLANWISFDNPAPPAISIVTNPDPDGVNTSSTTKVMKMDFAQNAACYAGIINGHGTLGTWRFDTAIPNNVTVSMQVNKSIAGKVGIKFVTPGNGTVIEVVTNEGLVSTLNEWVTLSWNISTLNNLEQSSPRSNDQIVIYADFTCGGADRVSGGTLLIDNITWNANKLTDPATCTDGIQNGTESGVDCGGNCAPCLGQDPLTAAPTPPARNATDVVSIFSNAYTNVTLDELPTVWSSQTTYAPIQIQGNDTWKVTGCQFLAMVTNYANGVDISAMETMHIDYWTPDPHGISVKIVNTVNGGEAIASLGTTVTGSWQSIDISMSAFAALVNKTKITQLLIDPANPNTLFIDNFYFYKTPNQAPLIAAPTPTIPAANVISMFSNAYTNVGVDTWRTSWSSGNLTDLQIAGNDTKKYDNLSFVGTETTGANLINASSMLYFHIDAWTPNMTQLKIKIVDFGANAAYAGGDDTEHELIYTPVQGSWNSYHIPLSDFTGLTNKSKIAQLILTSLPNGTGTLFFDNVYFSTVNLNNTDFTNDPKVKLYPNPTSNVLNIESLGTIQTISVYNVLGQEVINKALNSASTALDVSSLNSGIYVVKTVVDGVTSSTKFIKQ